MTTEASNFLSTFFGLVYNLFQITVPGLNVSFFALFSGVIITAFVIRFAFKFLGMVTSLGGGSMSEKLSRADRKYKNENADN